MDIRHDCSAKGSLWVMTGLLLISMIAVTLSVSAQAASAQSISDRNDVAVLAPRSIGLMTTVAVGPDGGTTIKTVAIDMQVYFATKGESIRKVTLPRGVIATPGRFAHANSDTGCFSAVPCTGQWGNLGDDDPPLPPGGSPPPNTGPGPGGGPSEAPPDYPDPPVGLDCNVGIVTYTQFYSNDQWKQTTTYKRDVNFGDDGSCTNSLWGHPVVNHLPKKQG